VEQREVVAFAVQLETVYAERWTPVIRYDTAHGFAHCDLFSRTGHVSKTPLGMPFGEARTFAERDILKRWEQYIRSFRGE
jgi:hypothetical protein